MYACHVHMYCDASGFFLFFIITDTSCILQFSRIVETWFLVRRCGMLRRHRTQIETANAWCVCLSDYFCTDPIIIWLVSRALFYHFFFCFWLILLCCQPHRLWYGLLPATSYLVDAAAFDGWAHTNAQQQHHVALKPYARQKERHNNNNNLLQNDRRSRSTTERIGTMLEDECTESIFFFFFSFLRNDFSRLGPVWPQGRNTVDRGIYGVCKSQIDAILPYTQHTHTLHILTYRAVCRHRASFSFFLSLFCCCFFFT